MAESPSPLLRELSSVVGLAATAMLIEAFGGVRLYVPKHPGPDHPLVHLIGPDAAQRLSARFGAADLPIPKAKGVKRLMRDQRLLADRASGMSVRRLALRYDLCERSIWEILAAHRKRQAGEAA